MNLPISVKALVNKNRAKSEGKPATPLPLEALQNRPSPDSPTRPQSERGERFTSQSRATTITPRTARPATSLSTLTGRERDRLKTPGDRALISSYWPKLTSKWQAVNEFHSFVPKFSTDVKFRERTDMHKHFEDLLVRAKARPPKNIGLKCWKLVVPADWPKKASAGKPHWEQFSGPCIDIGVVKVNKNVTHKFKINVVNQGVEREAIEVHTWDVPFIALTFNGRPFCTGLTRDIEIEAVFETPGEWVGAVVIESATLGPEHPCHIYVYAKAVEEEKGLSKVHNG